MTHLIGGIEAGGTKFVCAIGNEAGMIQEKIKFPTSKPEYTLPKIFDFFDKYSIEAIGIGSFGPIDIDPDSDTYGYITDTPKLAWKHFNFLGALKKHYAIPLIWSTDVNMAAYGEYHLGAGQGKNHVLYITVGTGVGVGYISNGSLYRGRSHPEGGHIMLRRLENDTFEGVCPYHKDCVEGLTSGPAIEKRVGKKGDKINPDHAVWKLEAYYLAQACMTYTLTFSPDIIVFGGGVMKQSQLFPMIRSEFLKLVNNYVHVPEIDKYIVPVALDDNAGIVGSILAAADKIV